MGTYLPIGPKWTEGEKVREVTLNQIIKGLTACSKSLVFSVSDMRDHWNVLNRRLTYSNISSVITLDTVEKILWKLRAKGSRFVKTIARIQIRDDDSSERTVVESNMILQTPKFLAWATGKMELLSTEMEKISGRAGLEKKTSS